MSLAPQVTPAAPIRIGSVGARPLRVLMTVDAVGGVWRYAMELGAALKKSGVETVFAGLGPHPAAEQEAEAEAIGELVWLDEPLDWMAADERELDRLPHVLERLVAEQGADLLHLNVPSQAGGLDLDIPVLAVSHSCVVTWWGAVRGGELPQDWRWQKARNRAGFDAADAVVAPSRSHAMLLERCYGPIGGLAVVPNAVAASPAPEPKEEYALAAARWWDDGKNVAVLDAAAKLCRWPVVAVGPTAGPDGQNRAMHYAMARGELPNRELLSLMRGAAVFVSPSLYEPFGLAPLEAARAKCALVLSDIPTFRELWGDAALFFDARDPNALAETLDRLAVHAGLRDALAAKALQRSQRFTPELQAGAMTRVYRTLVEAPLSAVEA